MSSQDGVEFDIIIPTFPVQDVPATAKYYADQLGFEITMMEGAPHVGGTIVAATNRHNRPSSHRRGQAPIAGD